MYSSVEELRQCGEAAAEGMDVNGGRAFQTGIERDASALRSDQRGLPTTEVPSSLVGNVFRKKAYLNGFQVVGPNAPASEPALTAAWQHRSSRRRSGVASELQQQNLWRAVVADG